MPFTVLVIEHNLDVIKVADYVIDMGPEGGNGGGELVGAGNAQIAAAGQAQHRGGGARFGEFVVIDAIDAARDDRRAGLDIGGAHHIDGRVRGADRQRSARAQRPPGVQGVEHPDLFLLAGVGLVDDAGRRFAGGDKLQCGAHVFRLGEAAFNACPHAQLLQRRLA